MQLRFTPPLSVRTTGVGFKQGLSVTLTGVTTIGAFTVVTFNSDKARTSIADSFEPIKQLLGDSVFLNGINQLGETLFGWGSSIVASKDAFKEWLNNYFGPDGLKSGAVKLYEKLVAWGEIVYGWFRDKFIEFIKNIPQMVKDWDKLRLSLFKWGTFLGGGGGGALWAMFGSFDNWGKLADLMGNEEFMGAVEKFSELVDKNTDAFKDMGQEAMQEILERIMEEPKDAKEIIEDLLKEQKDMAEKEKKEREEKQQKGEKVEDEEQKEPQLEQEHIKESLKKSKGSPQSKEEVFGYLVGDALKSLMSMPNSFDSPITAIKERAKDAINKYMSNVKEESKKKTKVGKANLEFLEAFGQDEEKQKQFVDELANIAKSAFSIGYQSFDELARAFEKIMQDKFTVPMEGNGEEGEGVDLSNMVKKPAQRKRR
ncbi:hypothetical protein A6V39_00460 [Candidatus Mycoplasma haematobovis]|uniref:Uncharacterized protein n=1 Tax=Candidatus Mycoplasma haematobovis TaxID=432608 RepID=A0A1A9QD58_9MOLU|nr:hypothetical protein [Candidatus Mycoplasma haematobovis]OAL10522.1 hypothetical protein A6V39_00460 [Candidatus Mycoplasma haematobovis]